MSGARGLASCIIDAVPHLLRRLSGIYTNLSRVTSQPPFPILIMSAAATNRSGSKQLLPVSFAALPFPSPPHQSIQVVLWILEDKLRFKLEFE
jgi:hypothetical protein